VQFSSVAGNHVPHPQIGNSNFKSRDQNEKKDKQFFNLKTHVKRTIALVG